MNNENEYSLYSCYWLRTIPKHLLTHTVTHSQIIKHIHTQQHIHMNPIHSDIITLTLRQKHVVMSSENGWLKKASCRIVLSRVEWVLSSRIKSSWFKVCLVQPCQFRFGLTRVWQVDTSWVGSVLPGWDHAASIWLDEVESDRVDSIRSCQILRIEFSLVGLA